MTNWNYIKALNSPMRREILKLLSQKNMSATMILKNLTYNKPKYRQSVHKQLEILVSTKLIEKYYDIESRNIMFKLKVKGIMIDISKMNLEIKI